MTKLLESEDSTLVVGDVHISADQNVRRADWLGYAIKELQPDRVVFIGDLMTFDCFSAWDKDKRKKMEGRRYVKEIAKGKEFLDRMYTQAGGSFSGEYILCEGNHEERVARYVDTNPEVEGALDYRSDLDISDWKFVPYKNYWKHMGVAFTHIPISEAGKPIGGKYVSHRALDLHQGSTVFGHTHKLNVASVHRHGSPHLSQALNVGCYFEHVDDYAVGSVTSYWRGLVLVDHYKRGRFGWHPLSMGKLRKAYVNK